MFLLTLLLYWSLHHMSYVFCFLLNLYTFTLWCMLRRHYMYHCINMHHFLLCDTNRDIQIYQSVFIKDIVNLFFQKNLTLVTFRSAIMDSTITVLPTVVIMSSGLCTMTKMWRYNILKHILDTLSLSLFVLHLSFMTR